MFCPKCGSQINNQAGFCVSCGYKMKENREDEFREHRVDQVYGPPNPPATKKRKGVVPECMLKRGRRLKKKEYK